MDIVSNNILFICVLFLGHISSAVSFKCYVCNGCPYRLNLTSDKYIIKDGCSKCLLTTQAQAYQPNGSAETFLQSCDFGKKICRRRIGDVCRKNMKNLWKILESAMKAAATYPKFLQSHK